MSIVRVGLAETKNFSEGYEAIFGKKAAGKTSAGTAGAKAKGPARKARAKARKPAKKARK